MMRSSSARERPPESEERYIRGGTPQRRLAFDTSALNATSMAQIQSSESSMLAAVVASRAPRLLTDVQPGDILIRPYAHYTRANAVPAPLYAELAEGFPSLGVIVNDRVD